MRLAQGDMRKVLNILQVLQKLCPSLFWQLFFQSCNMAFGKVTEDNVYTCVGKNFLTSAVDNLITSIFFNFCLKWSYPHWVQGTPFAPISQTSQIGLLTKTSPQPTSNDSHITLYWSVLETSLRLICSPPAKWASWKLWRVWACKTSWPKSTTMCTNWTCLPR